MSTQNLNTPAVFTDRKLDATDFADHDDVDATDFGDEYADSLPTPTLDGVMLGLVICIVSAIFVVVGLVHLIARVLS